MNWQLLKNVNPPVEKLLLFYYPDQTIRFALRSKDGKVFYIGESVTEGALDYGWYSVDDEYLKKASRSRNLLVPFRKALSKITANEIPGNLNDERRGFFYNGRYVICKFSLF